MMGHHDGQKELFSYQVDLDKCVRADHPVRAMVLSICLASGVIKFADLG
jgi:hypothetical protein